MAAVGGGVPTVAGAAGLRRRETTLPASAVNRTRSHLAHPEVSSKLLHQLPLTHSAPHSLLRGHCTTLTEPRSGLPPPIPPIPILEGPLLMAELLKQTIQIRLSHPAHPPNCPPPIAPNGPPQACRPFRRSCPEAPAFCIRRHRTHLILSHHPLGFCWTIILTRLCSSPPRLVGVYGIPCVPPPGCIP